MLIVLQPARARGPSITTHLKLSKSAPVAVKAQCTITPRLTNSRQKAGRIKLRTLSVPRS